MKRFIPLAMGASLFVGGVAVAVYGIYVMTRASASNDWPSVEGTINRSEIDKNRDSDGGGYTYHARVSYRYFVDNVEYRSKRIRFGHVSTSDPHDARHYTNQFPEGEIVRIYYDPIAPNEAILLPGIHGGTWLLPIFGTVFAASGILLMWGYRKALRIKRDDDKSPWRASSHRKN